MPSQREAMVVGISSREEEDLVAEVKGTLASADSRDQRKPELKVMV